MLMRNLVLNVEHLGHTRRKRSRSSMTFIMFVVHCLQSLNYFGVYVPLHLPRSISRGRTTAPHDAYKRLVTAEKSTLYIGFQFNIELNGAIHIQF